MSQASLEKAQAAYRKTEVPHFEIGDTVSVSVRIVEGEKERIQPFTGVVIARKGGGLTETFMVRRIVNNEGVERIFPVHSPKVMGVEVIRSGKVRRAKLYYLRDRLGKARRLRQRRTKAKAGPAEVKPESTEVEAESAEE